MAKAITQIEQRVPDSAAQQAQAFADVAAAVAKHKDAIVIFLDILDEAHKAGLLQIAQGALKNRHQIGVIGLQQMNKSGAQHVIKNTMGVMEFLGQTDPSRLKQVLGMVNGGMDRAFGQQQGGGGEKPGMWGLVRSFGEPEVQSSLHTLVNFLRGMGGGGQSQQSHAH